VQTTHPIPTEEFVGDDVRVSVKRQPSCRVELHVAVSKKMIEKARVQAIKAVNKDVTLPGFRSGKAPEALIVKKYSQEIEKRISKEMADLAFVSAQKLVNIAPLNQNSRISFDLKSQTEEGAALVFSFEEEPKVPSIDPKLFVAKPIKQPEVGEKQVTEAIRQMAFFYAEWSSVEDRGVQEGDFIMIDLDTIDGEKVDRVFNQVRFEVIHEKMASWMRNLVLGAKLDDVLEGVSEPDETASEEEKKEFSQKKVRVHILKIEHAVLPEINDDFAKKVGSPTVAAMHEMIAKILKDQVEEKVQGELREQINQFLVNTYAFDLPQSIVGEEVKYRHSQALKNSKFFEQWKNATQEEKEKITGHLVSEAMNALRMFYLARQIVADAKISITHQEVQDHAVSSRRGQYREEGLTDQISKEEFSMALSSLFLKKAQDFILEHTQ